MGGPTGRLHHRELRLYSPQLHRQVRVYRCRHPVAVAAHRRQRPRRERHPALSRRCATFPRGLHEWRQGKGTWHLAGRTGPCQLPHLRGQRRRLCGLVRRRFHCLARHQAARQGGCSQRHVSGHLAGLHHGHRTGEIVDGCRHRTQLAPAPEGAWPSTACATTEAAMAT